MIVTIFGGSGFLGGYIIGELLKIDGVVIRAITRDYSGARHLKLAGEPGRVIITQESHLDPKSIDKLVMGADVVINLIGSTTITKKEQLIRIHSKIPEWIAQAAARNSRIKQFIHFSALGIEQNSSLYAKSKLAGEKAVSAAFPSAIIIKPSFMYGAGDHFLTPLFHLTSWAPFIPLIEGGRRKIQPVFAGDIAQLTRSIIVKTNTPNNIPRKLEVGGGRVYSIKELWQAILKANHSNKSLINIPSQLAYMAAYALEMTLIRLAIKPITGSMRPLITVDQLKIANNDYITDKHTLSSFGINPHSLDAKALSQYVD